MTNEIAGPTRDWRRRLAAFVVFALLVVLGIFVTIAIDSAPVVKPTAVPTPSPTSTAKALGLLPSVDEGSPAAGKTTLVFDDEFNGTELDASKWNSGRYAATTTGDAPFNPGLEAAYYASSQVTEANGNLYLTLTPSKSVLNGKTYSYVSGMIQSEGHFALTPGTYIESRVKVNSCDGCWDAFWAQPSNKWPPEIDIFEFFQPDSAPRLNFHPESGLENGPTLYGQPNASYLDEFHTYGMYWDGVHATPYLDGKPYAPQPAATTIPLYVIFNLTVYDGHSPLAGSNMAIDWVRAWR
jgi:beta-glucanase (GH16 family)